MWGDVFLQLCHLHCQPKHESLLTGWIIHLLLNLALVRVISSCLNQIALRRLLNKHNSNKLLWFIVSGNLWSSFNNSGFQIPLGNNYKVCGVYTPEPCAEVYCVWLNFTCNCVLEERENTSWSCLSVSAANRNRDFSRRVQIVHPSFPRGFGSRFCDHILSHSCMSLLSLFWTLWGFLWTGFSLWLHSAKKSRLEWDFLAGWKQITSLQTTCNETIRALDRSRWGTLGFSVLRFWIFFWSVFRFSCSMRFADFSFFSIWFSVFVKNTTVFSVLVLNVVFGFSYFLFLFGPIWVYSFVCSFRFWPILLAVLRFLVYPNAPLFKIARRL